MMVDLRDPLALLDHPAKLTTSPDVELPALQARYKGDDRLRMLPGWPDGDGKYLLDQRSLDSPWEREA